MNMVGKNSYRDSSGTPVRLQDNSKERTVSINPSSAGRQHVSGKKQRLVSAKNRNYNVF